MRTTGTKIWMNCLMIIVSCMVKNPMWMRLRKDRQEDKQQLITYAVIHRCQTILYSHRPSKAGGSAGILPHTVTMAFYAGLTMHGLQILRGTPAIHPGPPVIAFLFIRVVIVASGMKS